jgi:curli biogenesis system outer membrane secretion channel CsgG
VKSHAIKVILVPTFAAACSSVLACEGTVELAGGSIGCRSYSNSVQVITFDPTDDDCKFSKKPDVTVSTSTGSPMDSMNVKVLSTTRKKFTAQITTAGRHANEVCAPTSFSWSAN